MDCIFCKIVEEKIPCNKVAETEHFIAFLDIHPISEGHTLIVPKSHSTNLLDMSERLGNEMLTLSQRIGRALIATGAEGFNLGVNNGPAAGQVVFHTHVHAIPRRQGDGLPAWPGHDAPPEKLAQVRAKIVDALR